jgi:hypothetical protein
MDKNSVERLLGYIEVSKSILMDEAYIEVRHYYDHGEYEMAFEGLVIELVKENKYPQSFVSAEWENLGIEFGLNKESIFDYYFWNKFIEWLKRT